MPCRQAQNLSFWLERNRFLYTNLSYMSYFMMERMVIFSIFLMIALQYNISLAQQCTVSCAQTAIIRNMPYEEILEVVQNREWETEDDFGEDLLDLIRRHKRVKRQGKLALLSATVNVVYF